MSCSSYLLRYQSGVESTTWPWNLCQRQSGLKRTSPAAHVLLLWQFLDCWCRSMTLLRTFATTVLETREVCIWAITVCFGVGVSFVSFPDVKFCVGRHRGQTIHFTIYCLVSSPRRGKLFRARGFHMTNIVRVFHIHTQPHSSWIKLKKPGPEWIGGSWNITYCMTPSRAPTQSSWYTI